MSFQHIRVLIAEDHAPFRRLIRKEFEDAADMEIVAEAADGEEAVALATHHAPHIVLMDVRMPKLSGIEATRALNEIHPNTRVLMLTVSDEESDLIDAIKAGASGYLLKDISPAEVVEAVRHIHAGEAILSSTVAPRLMKELADSVAQGSGPLRPLLTNRELHILQQLSAGLTSADVARKLGITESVVNHQVHNVLQKLQVQHRMHMLIEAEEVVVRESL
jgi:DNA-binding NarL/FixJ family response regulator